MSVNLLRAKQKIPIINAYKRYYDQANEVLRTAFSEPPLNMPMGKKSDINIDSPKATKLMLLIKMNLITTRP